MCGDTGECPASGDMVSAGQDTGGDPKRREIGKGMLWAAVKG
jgi:hypothetical protein